MNTVVVIPARKGSSRFPNKPLALIQGKSLLYRTWMIAKAVNRVSEVYIATDDEEIWNHAFKWGAKAIMTPNDCANGTERVFAAVTQIKNKPEIVLNFQGDAVLTPPWVVQTVVDEMQENSSLVFSTPATQLDWKDFDEFILSKANGRISGTLVVFNLERNALYFSKGVIPFFRERNILQPPIYRHIGLYAYRYSTLEYYTKLKVTPLEKMENLEQLRALENGIPIKVILVDYRGRTHWSIDNPEDVKKVEEIICREGELF